MVWGCMSGRGVGLLYLCVDTMRQDQYIRVLRNQMLPSAGTLYGEGQAFVFQQDNAPCHKARRVCDYLEHSGVEVLDWPAQSPDLNPIEHLWEVLYRTVQGKKPSSLDALWQLLSKAWGAIPADTIQVLVHSMPKRCSAVIKAKVLSPLPGGRLTWYSDVSTDPSLLGPDSCSEFHPGHVFWSDLGERKHIAAVHIRTNPGESASPKDCADIQHGGADTDGVYTIYPRDQPLQVYCDLTTDGAVHRAALSHKSFTARRCHTVRSQSGAVTQSVHRVALSHSPFTARRCHTGRYDGCTSVHSDNIHSLTTSGKHVLRIDLETFDGEKRFAEYSSFSIDDESNYYTLRLGAYLESSTMRDSLFGHNNRPFSTRDVDHDSSATSCAVAFHGAWWYTACHSSNLNGYYYQKGKKVSYARGIMWAHWKGQYESFKTATMKIRPAGFTPGHVTVAATDVDPRHKKPRDLPETSYRVCSVVPSKFSGLARCHLTDVYGRYVFIKAPSETKLKLCEVDVYPFPLPNMALRKRAENTVADFAVDGNITTCSLYDNNDDHTWLAVDLRGLYQVAEVIILTGKWNGQTNFDVGVTDIRLAADKPPPRLSTAEYHLCGVFVDTLQTHSRVRIPCQSASGRYVFVRRRATVNPMVLCEVEVYVQPPTLLVNAARDMAADQSSSPPLGGAMRAVDGNTSATWWHHTCSYTDREQNPWWRVDLVWLYDVWHVGVTNFEQSVLRDFAIWMSIDETTVPPSDGTLCARYSGPPRNVGVSHVTCVQPPVRARYVSLLAHGNNMRLMLCEVQVIGQLVTCPLLTPTDVEMYKDTNCTSGMKRYKETCEMSCELGYNLTSSDGVHKCTENSTWSNTNVTCELVRCPPIKKSDAEIYSVTCTVDTKVYNDTCEVSCELGYNLASSDGVHKCTENGTWSNNVTCEHITCDALPPDPHGKYFNATCTAQKTFYNESCQLECEFGYVANGNPVQTCQLNGNWSSHIHCIERLCPGVNDTVYARLVSSNSPFVPNGLTS
ncbi:Ficolin-2 [Lamellibrachia satsuma]|nr:Ficolin-2 [Lamellibrachia satsuma]